VEAPMFPLNDPMFYVCMITSVTIIYLVALAGSGRDNDNFETSNEKITPSAVRDGAQQQRRSQNRL
jgi:hypothetical protein